MRMDRFVKYFTFFVFFYVITRLIVWIANQTVGLPTAGAADLFVTVGVLLVSGIAAYNSFGVAVKVEIGGGI